jgi:O-antigen ligase
VLLRECSNIEELSGVATSNTQHATVGGCEQPQNIVTQVGFYAVLAFVFCYTSRILDITVPFLRIPLILGVVYLCTAALTMRLTAFLKYPAGKALAAFFLWMLLLAFPFSIWRGGSVESITLTGRSMLMVIGIIALVTTLDDVFKMMHAIGYAVMTAGLISFRMGVENSGRLELEQGILADPNAMAMALLVGVPFLVMKGQSSGNMFVKAILYACVVPVLIAVARTGSRSGMLTVVVMALVLFYRSTGSGKLMMMAAAVAALLIAPFVISDHLKARYMTLFKAGTADLNYAADSARARSQLFWRSLELTIRNPIVGVGPGMFAHAENEYSREQFGVRGQWHTTHNTYTQVSSENGIPALLFYGFALGSAWMIPRRLLKAIPRNTTGERKQIRNAALALELSVTAFATSAMFLSLAHMGIPFILIGISVAFGAVATRVLATAPDMQQVRPPGPAFVVKHPASAIRGNLNRPHAV